MKMNNSIAKSKIKILIADDFLLLRTAWKILLTTNSEFDVVGAVEDGMFAIDFVGNNAVDVVLMDISMPNVNGVDATAVITRIDPSVKVIALSMHNEFHHINKMVKAGAKGFVNKAADKDELFKAIYDVYNNVPYISPVPPSNFAEKLDRSTKINSINFL
jgi:DNA-binding NarL/FixJ family response regulator